MPSRMPLPDDVEPEQVWRTADRQDYRVDHVVNGVAALHRCTPAGRVLNQRYTEKVPVDRMQADWGLVSRW